MAYWTVARTEPNREAFATQMLGLAGFTTYLPRLRVMRRYAGRKIETRPVLFPNYLFVLIEAQWHAVRWTWGVSALVMNGGTPAKVPDVVIAEIRGREVRGLVQLPARPPPRPGDQVRIVAGVFTGHLALFQGMRDRERVEVVLAFLGRLTLPADAVEAV